MMNNCVFVTNTQQGKDVPMNITAWGDNAKFIQEHFNKGDSIQLVAQETPHDRKVGDKAFTECIFTVRKVLDWDMYINTVKFLGNTLSRLENSFTERTQEAQKEDQAQKSQDGYLEVGSDADDSNFNGYEFEEEAGEQQI
ncbi:MAG TPA: hypothetical protein VIK78_08060 [Ruminiclostridium sp.]